MLEKNFVSERYIGSFDPESKKCLMVKSIAVREAIPANTPILFSIYKRFIVVDVDLKNESQVAEYDKFVEEYGLNLLDLNTFIIKTPTNGYHVYLKLPLDFELNNIKSKLDKYPNIEIKNSNAYLNSTSCYKVVGDNKVYYTVYSDLEVIEVPAIFLELILKNNPNLVEKEVVKEVIVSKEIELLNSYKQTISAIQGKEFLIAYLKRIKKTKEEIDYNTWTLLYKAISYLVTTEDQPLFKEIYIDYFDDQKTTKERQAKTLANTFNEEELIMYENFVVKVVNAFRGYNFKINDVEIDTSNVLDLQNLKLLEGLRFEDNTSMGVVQIGKILGTYLVREFLLHVIPDTKQTMDRLLCFYPNTGSIVESIPIKELLKVTVLQDLLPISIGNNLLDYMDNLGKEYKKLTLKFEESLLNTIRQGLSTRIPDGSQTSDYTYFNDNKATILKMSLKADNSMPIRLVETKNYITEVSMLEQRKNPFFGAFRNKNKGLKLDFNISDDLVEILSKIIVFDIAYMFDLIDVPIREYTDFFKEFRGKATNYLDYDNILKNKTKIYNWINCRLTEKNIDDAIYVCNIFASFLIPYRDPLHSTHLYMWGKTSTGKSAFMVLFQFLFSNEMFINLTTSESDTKTPFERSKYYKASAVILDDQKFEKFKDYSTNESIKGRYGTTEDKVNKKFAPLANLESVYYHYIFLKNEPTTTFTPEEALFKRMHFLETKQGSNELMTISQISFSHEVTNGNSLPVKVEPFINVFLIFFLNRAYNFKNFGKFLQNVPLKLLSNRPSINFKRLEFKDTLNKVWFNITWDYTPEEVYNLHLSTPKELHDKQYILVNNTENHEIVANFFTFMWYFTFLTECRDNIIYETEGLLQGKTRTTFGKLLGYVKNTIMPEAKNIVTQEEIILPLKNKPAIYKTIGNFLFQHVKLLNDSDYNRYTLSEESYKLWLHNNNLLRVFEKSGLSIEQFSIKTVNLVFVLLKSKYRSDTDEMVIGKKEIIITPQVQSLFKNYLIRCLEGAD